MKSVGPLNKACPIDEELLDLPVNRVFLLEAQRMPPLCRQSLIFSTPVNAEELLSELHLKALHEDENRHVGANDTTPPSSSSSSPSSSSTTAAARVLRLQSVFTAAQCGQLRRLVDTEARQHVDSVDGAPDHQVNLSVRRLCSLLGHHTITDLLELVLQMSSQLTGVNSPTTTTTTATATATAATTTSAGSISSLEEMEDQMQIFVRKYSHTGRPWIPWHRDAAERTINVALCDDAQFQGGCLLVADDCRPGMNTRSLVRRQGEATVHASTLLHAVSMMTAGTRYSLIIFWGQKKKTEPLVGEQHQQVVDWSVEEQILRRMMKSSPRVTEEFCALFGHKEWEAISEKYSSCLQNGLEAAIANVVETYGAPHLTPTKFSQLFQDGTTAALNSLRALVLYL